MVFGRIKRFREEPPSSEPKVQIVDENTSDGEEVQEINRHTTTTKCHSTRWTEANRRQINAFVRWSFIFWWGSRKKIKGALKVEPANIVTNISKALILVSIIIFFCAPAGVSADIRRCNAILKDRAEFDFPLFKREKLVPKCTIEESFKIIDRDMVNMTILRCFCANGLSFNLLRSPYFHEMVTTINKGSKSYKSPSYEKARMSLLDECRNNLEKELFLVPIHLVQTWSFDCL